MKKKGFTLIELLVVIAIIAMLLAILMPALNKVKKIAQRVVCGTNLKGLGTALTVYANGYDDEYVVQGNRLAHTWADETAGWQNTATNCTNTVGNITVGASLYMLVREADVSPASFVCPASSQQEFTGKNASNLDITELYDFGNLNWTPPSGGAEGPVKCVSYAYHNPYNGTTTGRSTGSKGIRAATGSCSAAFAIMADRNPYIDDKLTNGGLSVPPDNYLEVVSLVGGATAPAAGQYDNITDKRLIKVANAQSHERESQNVLFGDGHVGNRTRPDSAVRNDCIYTSWTVGSSGALEVDVRRGNWPGSGAVLTSRFIPQGTDDSVLVNDAVALTLQ